MFAFLRYPQWGIRIRCEKLPNPEVNLWGKVIYFPSNHTDSFLPRIPLSSRNYTDVFVPRDFLQGLFGVYGLDLPTQFMEADLAEDGTVPSNIGPSAISYLGEFFSVPLVFAAPNQPSIAQSPLDGKPIYFFTTTPDTAGNRGWSAVDTVVVRLNTSLTPSGRFPVYSNLSDTQTRVGYDAAVCVQLYEPWIVEAHNTTGSPSILGIVGKGDGSTSLSPSGYIRGDPIAATRYLNTTGKHEAFPHLHLNSYARMTEFGLQWDNYVPPPIVGPVALLSTTLPLTLIHPTGHSLH